MHDLDLDFTSNAFAVESEISEQPNTAGETKKGSINRAKNVIKKFPDSDFGIGVEFGYEPGDNKFHMICWASIYTIKGEIYSEHSSSMELPKDLAQALKENIEVDSVLMDTIIKLPGNQVGRKFIEYVKKRRIIYECVENVVMRYMLNNLYE